MDGWSLALLAAAGYVAVTALVRLMIRRRDQLVEDFRRQVQPAKNRRPFQQPDSPQPGREKKAA